MWSELSPVVKVYTVSEITNHIRILFHTDPVLTRVVVKGEISNVSFSPAGHVYFVLKDGKSQLGAVMWQSRLSISKVRPANGDKVNALGRVSVYETSGKYQIVVDELRADGAGDLYAAFLRLKEKLNAEGLFDPARKKALPVFPRTVGLITSAKGAAVQDMLRILHERCPSVKIVISAASVQGEEAPGSLRAALHRLRRLGTPDVIIIGRGGGSFEELNAFNDEGLARAIFACPIPIVSAVGHETDFTIADMVADERCPTPTAAAQRVVPNMAEHMKRLLQLRARLAAGLRRRLERDLLRLKAVQTSFALKNPERLLESRRLRVDDLSARLQRIVEKRVARCKTELERRVATLEALSPEAVFSRGYSITLRATDGRIVRSIEDVREGDACKVRVSDGTLQTRVEARESRTWRNLALNLGHNSQFRLKSEDQGG